MARKVFRRFRLLGTFEPAWLDLSADQDMADALTADQINDIHRFLTSPNVPPILALLTLVNMSHGDGDRKDSMDTVQRTFEIAAIRWNADSTAPWRKNIHEIWQRITSIYDELFGSTQIPALTKEIDEFSGFVSSPLQLPKPSQSGGLYLQRVIDLASDLDKLVKAAQAADELAAAIHSTELESIITHSHAELEHNADFLQLYVPRQFVDPETNEILDAEQLALDGHYFRTVLMGSPGAGKTTFVSHLVYAASGVDETDTPLGVVVVRCRDYVSKSWDIPVTRFMAQQVSAQTSTHFQEDELNSVFTLGRAVVVFDGLDEVTDRNRRAEMVKRIHAFTSRFPAVSILVTTREVGYEHSPLSRTVFNHVRLSEFTLGQVRDYSARWFTLVGKPELAEPFLTESESVEDLRPNPLLLSLLCILYRDSGAIPADRRGIYSKCAELLFTKWDMQRQITQSGSMPKFADRLMQEIARWFYTTPSTQAGLEEQQIAKVLAQYMVQALGFSSDEAERNAREFLAFCAGRAWLLGVIGTNSYGQRLFRFTHRTFYEYFTAESLTRQSGSPDEICSYAIEAWNRDSTSVVPELMVQSYDFSHERGAARVLKQLCTRNAHNLLLLRLLEGAILPNYARKVAFDLIWDRWRRSEIDSLEFISLLSISSQARIQLIEDYLDPSRDARNIHLFLSAWSSLETVDLSRQYRKDWNSVVHNLVQAIDLREACENDPTACLVNWAIGHGYDAPLKHGGSAWLVCGGIFGASPGVVWWSIQSVFGQGKRLDSNERRMKAVRQTHEFLNQRDGIPAILIEEIHKALLLVGQGFVKWRAVVPHDEEEKLLRDIFAIVLCAMFENDENLFGFLGFFDNAWSGKLSAVMMLHNYHIGGGPRLTDDELRKTDALLLTLPVALRQWARGDRQLVRG